MEVDEAMFLWGLRAAANRLPFLPVRAASAPTSCGSTRACGR